MMKTDLYFNKIYVIESLRPEERKTGTSLYENVLKYRIQPYKAMRAQLCVVKDKTELLNLLEQINSDTVKYAELPCLHFEMHGSTDRDGLILENQEIIRWDELSCKLRKVNINCGNNLFLSMATCYGAHIIRGYNDLARPCPFYGFIGPQDSVGEKDLEESYEEYFAALLDAQNFKDAFENLRKANPNNPGQYVLLTSNMFFDFAIEKLMTKSERKKSAKSLYKMARKDVRYRHLSNNRLRAEMNQLRDAKEGDAIEELRTTFTLFSRKVATRSTTEIEDQTYFCS